MGRVALARALFLKPHLLLLDEPTNHLDLEACVWLEEELKTYPTILVIVSHSQDFLNGVCNNIMHFDQRKLKMHGGNYDTFVRTRMELEENQMKQYQWEQDQIAHMKIARYHQHLHELLEMDMTPLDYMMFKFPEFKERDQMRKVIGRYGITGKAQTAPIKQLSDGQKCRVVFAWLSWQVPHMLLLDEPTNHLDMETIDALADAINGFEGGVILVSHDFRLIDQVAQEIWICEKQKVSKWEGDILSYKDHLKGKVMKESNKDAKKKGLDKSSRGAW